MRKSQVRKLTSKANVKFVYLQFTDLLGTVKNIAVDIEKFWESLDTGLWFDGSSVEGFARIAESDMHLRPDLSTFAILPWSDPERQAAKVICNIHRPNGRRLSADPRGILQKVITKAEKLRFNYKTAAEFEFYLFERDSLPKLKTHDKKSYFDYTPHSRASIICESTMQSLSAFGIKGEMYHHEVGNGQHEIDIKYDSAVKSADNIVAVKTALKAYTNGTELKSTWMPKPIFGSAGNGMHIHQSLWKEKANVFYNKRRKYHLSKLAGHFLAGQLAHAKALSAIVSPTVNSYKRLVPGYEAPVYICWGQQNRSALIRIPQITKENAATGTRLEYRAPDCMANPYLAFAALLAAGLDGVEKKMVPPKSVEEDVYHYDVDKLSKNRINTLPANLKEATDELRKDKVILNIFGTAKDRFLEIKEKEWKEFSTQVTGWEVKRYL